MGLGLEVVLELEMKWGMELEKDEAGKGWVELELGRFFKSLGLGMGLKT